MSKKKTTEEFKEDLNTLGNGEYILLTEYVNNKTPVKLFHKPCKLTYDVKPNYFMSGNRCPLCAGKLRKDTEYFKCEVEELVGNEYAVLGEYVNTHTKIKFKHITCKNEFDMTPHNFLAGQRCPKCQHRSYPRTTEEFKQEIYDLVGDEYELIGEYVNLKTKVTLFHKSCQRTYTPNPGDFLYGYRCIHCYGNEKKTQEEFEHDVYETHGNEYTVVGKYVNYATKVRIRHNMCEYEWDVNPRDFLSKKSGCPRCAQSKGEKRIENFLIDHNIFYIPQKKFDGLVGVNNGLLSYDFFLPDFNFLIEYQGEFHDGLANDFVAQNLERQQEHDKRKREYSTFHGINLLEIWYWDFENIENILESRLLKERQLA